MEKIDKCIFCSSRGIKPLLRATKMPASSQSLYKSQREAVNCQSAGLDIVMCQDCRIVFNGDYFTSQAKSHDYKDPDYYSSMSFSTQSMHYQKQLAEDVAKMMDLKGKSVCEIGCGDGFFLEQMSRYCKQAVGFEPSPTFQMAKKYENIEVHNDYFDPAQQKQLEGKSINLFVLRHVLEHISDPLNYLESLNKCYRVSQDQRALFLEVPNVSFLMENNLYFDFYYDHIYYFTSDYLISFLKKLGWKNVTEIESSQGEFLRIFCSNDQDHDLDQLATDYSGVDSFAKGYQDWRQNISQCLSEIKSKGKKIGAWGAGSRGVTMISSIDQGEDFFNYVIDSDINKQKRFIPLLGIPVASSDALSKQPLDYLLITSYTYFNEIVKSIEKYRDKGLKIIKPYPEIEII
ncbi:MAG: methyltransferase domain-containing protein [Candidatus Omnitrophica bacterium]|nr:methyltransferase domain-containing protein [Candidatus Omnitrophota bacterium]